MYQYFIIVYKYTFDYSKGPRLLITEAKQTTSVGTKSSKQALEVSDQSSIYSFR